MTRAAAVVATTTLEDAFGRHPRQQLGWLGFATTLIAVGSLVLLWWGGAELVRWLSASIQ